MNGSRQMDIGSASDLFILLNFFLLYMDCSEVSFMCVVSEMVGGRWKGG